MSFRYWFSKIVSVGGLGMRRILFTCVAACLSAVSTTSQAQTLAPINSFGVSAPGWLAPGDHGSNNDISGSTLRGIAYHPQSNRLILIDRAAPAGPTVRILDADTGVQVHTLSQGTGIVTGGTFLLGMVGVDDDGNVYVCNLATLNTSNFRVYRWSSNAVVNLTTEVPTVAHGVTSGRIRTGDSFAVTGSGLSTRFVSAGGNLAGDGAFALLSTADGLNFTATNPVVTGQSVGAFRLGIAFDGQGQVLGSQTGLDKWRAPATGGTAVLFSGTDASESIIGYEPQLGLFATITYTGGLGNTNTVRLYRWNDFGGNPILLDTQNLTNVSNGNGNATGAISFGYDPNGKLRLYALNTNNGIQAFEVQMPSNNASIVGRSVVHGGWTGVGSAADAEKVLHKADGIPTALSINNLINTGRGINGIQFQIQDLADEVSLSADDFEFQVSPIGAFDQGSNPPSGWAPAAAPTSVSVSGSDPHEVLIQWPDNAIANRWLRITVKATANTGLATDEVYYIGHLLGETTGDAGGAFTVAFADITPIRSAVGSSVNSSSVVDIDKNGIVAFADISAMRSNVGSQLTVITVQ